MKKLYSYNSIPEEFEKIIQIGIHHEQQHQELLMDIKYILAGQPFNLSYKPESRTVNPIKGTNWQHYDEGIYEIGYSKKGFLLR